MAAQMLTSICLEQATERGDQMHDMNSVKDLLTDQIKDLYSAEKQLTEAIPKMVDGSHDGQLKLALQDHLTETEGQVVRLEEVAALLEIEPTGKMCLGIAGVIQEGGEALGEKGDDTIVDLGIIGAGCRVEHYEMAAYMTAIHLAERLNAREVVALLKKSLDEEQAAETKLREISTGLIENTRAVAV
jgi:ferritin-like metal-binding protein YciE